jgi:hypothetical protein
VICRGRTAGPTTARRREADPWTRLGMAVDPTHMAVGARSRRGADRLAALPVPPVAFQPDTTSGGSSPQDEHAGSTTTPVLGHNTAKTEKPDHKINSGAVTNDRANGSPHF